MSRGDILMWFEVMPLGVLGISPCEKKQNQKENGACLESDLNLRELRCESLSRP